MSGIVVDLVQGTPEWAAWRFSGIGGSDSPAVLGKSPYKTRRQLAVEKINRVEVQDSGNEFIFAKGHRTEALIRKHFQDYIGAEANPVCMVHPKYSELIVSLDGLTSKHGVLEAKLVGKDILERAEETGEIPEHHKIQIQHACNVSGADKGQWFGHNGKDAGILIEVPADKKLMATIEAEELSFWALVQDGIIPELSDDDYLIPDDMTMLEELREMRELLDNAEIEFDRLKKAVIDSYRHPKIAGAGLKVFQTVRQGSIDYMKIPEVQAAINALDSQYIESFRKAASKSWTVKIDAVKKAVKNG